VINQVLNVGRWEWFKLSRRWLPWILLVLLVVFSQVAIWGNLYAYSQLKANGATVRYGVAGQSRVNANCNDLLAGRVPAGLKSAQSDVISILVGECNDPATQQQLQVRLQGLYQHFTAPGSLVYILQQGQVVVVLLATILGASLIGAEYGLGTLRPILGFGTGRWQYLAGKLLLMAIAVLAALTMLAASSYGASLAAKALKSAPPGGALASNWTDVWRAFGKDWFGLLPALGLTACVTIIVGSTASGMAIALGYYFAELVLVVLFAQFSWFDRIANYLLGRAMSGWNGGGPFNADTIPVPSDLRSIIVLSVYSIVLGGLAFAFFVRRDVKGAVGS
jgi:ABC-type transport system involved in multi-copper enzyme maturation permease subunit